MKESITFMDTNIIIPQKAWELSNIISAMLRNNENATIEQIWNSELVEDSRYQLNNTRQLIGSYDDLAITDEIEFQAMVKLNPFISDLDNLLGPEKIHSIEIEDSYVYSDMEKSAQYAREIHDKVSASKHTLQYDAIYHYIDSMVTTLCNDFFNVTKEDHNYDYHADERIVSAAIYETIVNRKNSSIISNDHDIAGIMGISINTLRYLHDNFDLPKAIGYVIKNQPKLYRRNHSGVGVYPYDYMKGFSFPLDKSRYRDVDYNTAGWRKKHEKKEDDFIRCLHFFIDRIKSTF